MSAESTQTPQPSSPPETSADALRRELLADERLISEILAIRKPRDRWWNSSQLLTGLVAIVSIVVSSFATVQTQRSAKSTEFTLAQRSALLEQRRKLLADIATIVAQVEKSSQDRLLFARGIYDSLPRAEQQTLLDSASAVDDRWNVAGKTSEILLLTLYGDSSGVPGRWRNARDSLQSYVRCVENNYKKYQRGRDPSSTSCVATQVRADSTLNRFFELVLQQTDRGGK